MQTLIAVLLSTPGGSEAPDYNRDVRPILASKCLACHGTDPKHREGGLRLDDRPAATTKLKDGATAISPGKPFDSELLRRVRADDDERMPPKGNGERLSDREIATLERWIAAGAKFDRHWSFVPPKLTTPPVVPPEYRSWVRNPIDAFTLASMTEHGLSPSPQADSGALLRRVSLDLTGLPPSPERVDDFLKSLGKADYERMVDRLLADPAFGERWARVWLDLARYADSAGYGSDPLRTIWRYRDWVIEACNRDMRFDEFTRVQLAGDLRRNASLDDLIATAFHRNTMTNTEGGTDDEEFRVAAIKDRTDVTMQVWMGLTVGCAKCHSHKYDPISQKEYYQLFAFFNQTADNDQPSEVPTIPAPTANQRRENKRIDREISRLRSTLQETTPELVEKQQAWEKGFASDPNQLWKRTNARAVIDGNWLRITADLEPGATGIRVSGPSEIATDALWADVRVEAAPKNVAEKPIVGRIVRIDLLGKERMIHLAEVEVYSGGANIARQGTARQSSTYLSADAKRAIDGNRDGNFEKGSTTHTNPENDPWWEVDLGRDVAIERIGVWNRTDSGLANRLKGWRVSVLDKDRKAVWTQTPESAPQPSLELAVNRWNSANVRRLSPAILAFDKALDEAATIVRVSANASAKSSPMLLDKIMVESTTDHTLPRRAGLPAAIRAILETSTERRTAQQRQVLADYFRIEVAGASVKQALAKLEASRPKAPTVPVMQELPRDKRRSSHILTKGNFLQPAEVVVAAVPMAFHPWSASAPRDRAGLADWLVARDNPLTARVAVNRLWARLFGRGLVETEEDFGVQGEPPSHPELLDWLANEYVRSGWDRKAMLRLMVTSSTYRQSAKSTPTALEKDPQNRWLSRYPRLRLEAEMVRDQALALSGKLTRTIGGPSVFPPQPDGLWQAAFNGERTWATSTNADRYRRALYVFWRRTVPYPSMAAFDAPSRETCTLRRKSTNTPIQAFVTLNDPAYVELARGLASRIVRDGGATTEMRARFGLRLCLCCEPTPAQVTTIAELVARTAKEFNASDAKRFAGEPAPGMSAEEFAAWMLAANALMNLDGVLTKG